MTSEAAPLCILASAGAGKTRVLTRRIAYRAPTGDAEPRHTLALTFTRKAAGELQQRLRQLGLREQVCAGTFHALAAAQLHRWWADRGQRPPALLGPQVPAAGAAGGEPAGAGRRSRRRPGRPHRVGQGAAASPRSVRVRRPGGGSGPAPLVSAPGAVASLYARYEDEKVRRGLVDFDDLLAGCADAIDTDPVFAAAQRWRWRHLFVDEFQDLNPLQHRLLLAWLGTSTDLCVVGDPHQAVYGWNGADPDLLSQVATRWPSTEVVYLDDNHRCTPQIVAAGAAVLGPAGRPAARRRSGRTAARLCGPIPPRPPRLWASRPVLRQAQAAGQTMGRHGGADPHQRPVAPDPGALAAARYPVLVPGAAGAARRSDHQAHPG